MPPSRAASRRWRWGPVASQEAIKLLGTNGGGFFNVNSSMPFENPSGLVELRPDADDPADPGGADGHVRADGGQPPPGLGDLRRDVHDVHRRRGGGLHRRDARLAGRRTPAGLAGGNLEGKEVRFGQANSALFTVITTAASCGAVTSAHDSLTGIGGRRPAVQHGHRRGRSSAGSAPGLYGMLLFVLLAVFIAGLMVGRTPEYLGKKIEAREVKLVMIGTLAVPLMVPVRHGAGGRHEVRRAVDLQPRARRASPRPSTPTPRRRNNNGSAFAGFTGYVQPNSPGNVGAFGITFADLLGGVAMLVRTVRAAGGRARGGRRAGGQEGRPGQRRDVPHRLAHLRGPPDRA